MVGQEKNAFFVDLIISNYAKMKVCKVQVFE